MLLKSKEIILAPDPPPPAGTSSLLTDHGPSVFVSDQEHSLNRAIGRICNGKAHHYYSRGNFNLVRLICYLLRQTGPAHLMMTSYSFSRKSIEQLQNRIEKKEILSFKIILDNRVRVMSPLPFQMITESFDYKCVSVHAKIALIWNDQWKITIITSQNATDNPKLERGTIFTDPEIFDFDFKNLCDEFERGTT
jgi:hypothetical protein